MTTPVCPAWQLPANWKLADWMSVRDGAMGDTLIYWVEVPEKFSPGSTSSHINQPAAGELTFWTDFTSINDPARREILELSILGGYDSGAAVMYPPWAHPQNPNLFASSLDIKPASIDNTTPNVTGSMAAYRRALCKVGFQALPYTVNQDAGELGYNPNWLEYRPSDANLIFTAPVGNYIFSAGSYIGKSATLGTVYTGGVTYFEVIAHRVPITPLLDLSSGSPLSWCGSTNTDTIFGAAGGQLFLQSIDCGDGPFGDFAGNILVNAHLHLIFNPNGWDTSLDKDGTWQEIQTVVGANPPLPFNSFVALINNLLPANA